jgi:uncharacterized protein YecE (DUF72 family)
VKTKRIRVGCSGWYYRHWKGVVYPPELPASQWFGHYHQTFDTVELNAPFYHWPKPATVQKWARQATSGFRYSVKVNRRITHLKRFNGTRKLVRDFYRLAGVLGKHTGCFLFQLPPSFHYTPDRLRAIAGQLDARHRNAVEFRHESWWNDEVFKTFEVAGLIFCSVSAPRLPDDVITTADAIYVRFHGAKQWYRHNYSGAELKAWAQKIRSSRAREIWAYFNNDFQGCAFCNAQTLKRLLR